MEFKSKQAIYLQIAEYARDQILSGKWPSGEKIISIRDLSVILSVNANTVQRAFDHLQQQGVLINKRGVGYFVDETAVDKIREMRRQSFLSHDLPEFIIKMQQLGLNFDIVMKRFTLLLQKKN